MTGDLTTLATFAATLPISALLAVAVH